MKHQPPKWADRFLKWYCDPKLLEEIEGDIYELFDRRIKSEGPGKAKMKFVWDVLRFFRLSNIKKGNRYRSPLFGIILIRSFLNTGLRHIYKNLTTSLISILGLAIALGLCITSIIFYDIQVNLDEFHTKGDRIYQVTRIMKSDEGRYLAGNTPIPLGPSILKDYTAIEEFVRIEQTGAYVSASKKTFEEKVAFVDPGFFTLFDFEFYTGDRNSLKRKNTIVISYEMAKKYFPDNEPIGKVLKVKFSNNHSSNFEVAGILKPYSNYASFSFDFYIPFDHYFDEQNRKSDDWEQDIDATFVLIRKEKVFSELLNDERYLSPVNEDKSDLMTEGYVLFSLYSLSENSQNIRGSISWAPPSFTRMGLAFIAFLMLLLAIFNYINISIASSTRRLKEIAIRKVIGSNRLLIIFQFMTENILLCALAFGFGYFLSYSVFVPGLDQMLPMNIPFSFSSWEFIMTPMVLLFILTALISGAYPAYYISRFESNVILKGSERFGNNSIISRVLLGFQLTLAFIMIIGSLVFVSQSRDILNMDWGYDPENRYVIRTTNQQQTKLLKQELLNLSSVKGISVSRGQIGLHSLDINFLYEDIDYHSTTYFVDHFYQQNMGLSLIRGSWLSDRIEDKKGIVINESFARKLIWQEPIGKQIYVNGDHLTVIGVVRDFKHRNFNKTDTPVMFQHIENYQGDGLTYLTLNIQEGKMEEVSDYVAEAWLSIAPGEPYVARQQDTVFDGFYEQTVQSGKILITLSTIAILLACLGLFGLLSFSIQKRLKEFSIRKVLGASAMSIVWHVTRQYLPIIVIAFVLGILVGNMLIYKLLYLMFNNLTPLSFIPYLMAFMIILVTILITISGQIIKATRVNPVENLRSE